jgi:diguanylate cyclase (GGDEF)-like protein
MQQLLKDKAERIYIMKNRILIIEDDIAFSRLVINRLDEANTFESVQAMSFAEASALLKTDSNFLLALVDLHLPDAESNNIVDLVKNYNIPVVVNTSDISDKVRELIWSKNIVDYVIKEGPHTLDYLYKLVTRISRNSNIKILVVDDSKLARTHERDLLEVHLYNVFEAASGEEALKILHENPDIRLVIVDYNMPGMDGIELTRNIRSKFSMDKLGIIGLSSINDQKLSVNFIKNGANDFINKPFLAEQLYCRITQNIELLEQFDIIRQMSSMDYLTKLYNRRYLINVGEILFNNAKRSDSSLVLALIDIDHFKKINDTYGHESGDLVLINLAAVLKQSFRKSDVVSRYGGEEFCVLANNMNIDNSFQIFDQLRSKVENAVIANIGNKDLQITISIGVCCEPGDSLNDMINEADKKLYEAKRNGRNRVVI